MGHQAADQAHGGDAMVEATREAERRWPGCELELENDTDRGEVEGRSRRYRLRVWTLRENGNGRGRRRLHASGYGPTPMIAVERCTTYKAKRRRQKALRGGAA